MPKVGVVLGSKSDMEAVKPAVDILEDDLVKIVVAVVKEDTAVGLVGCVAPKGESGGAAPPGIHDLDDALRRI